MGWLKQLLRDWLEVPDESPRAAPKASGALYAEIRKAREEVAGLLAEVRRTHGWLHAAVADHGNALQTALYADQKVDAMAKALGVYLVPPPPGEDQVGVSIDGDARAFYAAKKCMDAEVELREMQRLRAIATRTLHDIATVEREVRRHLAGKTEA